MSDPVADALVPGRGSGLGHVSYTIKAKPTLATFNDTITQGTATFSLDLRADTGGLAISGLQFILASSPAGLLTYAAVPLTALGNPFTTTDIASAPNAGATVNQSTTVFFKASNGDYAPFADSAIARYTFDTSKLTPGTYVFTPIGQELTNANTSVTTFASPGSFTLVVSPEPGVFVMVSFGGMFLFGRRRGLSSEAKTKRQNR